MTNPSVPARAQSLGEKLTGELAAALARRLDTLEEILKRFNLTEEQLGKLLDNPSFQDMMREANIQWSAAPSTPERIRIKAQLATEELIPEIYAVAANGQNPLGPRLDAAKLLYEITGNRQAQAAAAAAGAPSGVQDKFTLILNIGPTPVTIEAKTIEPASDG